MADPMYTPDTRRMPLSDNHNHLQNNQCRLVPPFGDSVKTGDRAQRVPAAAWATDAGFVMIRGGAAGQVVDLHDLRRGAEEAGRRFRIVEAGPQQVPVAPGVSSDAVLPVLKGRTCTLGFPSGLILHATDGVHLRDMTVATEAEPELTLTLFLEGGADITLDGKTHYLGVRPGEGPCGLLFNRTRYDWVTRRAVGGTRIRKVSVSMPPDWQAAMRVGDHAPLALPEAFLKEHGALHRWPLPEALIAAAERLLALPDPSPLVNRIRLEGLALELVAQALQDMTARRRQTEECADSATLREATPRDHCRIATVVRILEDAGDRPPGLDELARAAGMSVSTLQRVFHTVHGTSVAGYLRRHRLEQARRAMVEDGVSVTEAAFVAGYTSPANFSTAFRREFGYPPRLARGQDGR